MEKYPLIGKLALQNRLISKKDLNKALSLCTEKGKALEEELIRVFVSTKIIPSKIIENLEAQVKTLNRSERKLKFGDIAIEQGFVSRTNLEFLLEEQEKDILNEREPGAIGSMLIEAGMMNPQQRDKVLEIQKEADKEREKAGKEKTEPEGPGLMEPVDVSHGIEMQVSSDFLAVYLKKTDNFKTSCTVNDVRDILKEKEIIFEIVTDEMIVNFLKSPVFKEKLFRVAKGIAPVHGKDAEIEYFFNFEHLKAGGVKQDGQIDFKDRGEIPQVDKGMILAEKTPMIEPKSGKNIFGESIIARAAKDQQLKIGQGASLSPNKLQVIAAVKGHPRITPAGEISVKQEYIINGDVDYETGHVDYEDNVNIKGCVKNGFKVKADNVKAFEIEGGIVETRGDLTVLNGIINADINVKGDISAKFIHQSRIRCTGEVIVGKEIIDAIIEDRGKCVVEGKIISSDITSKMGVFARDIGTEKGRPSVIKAGIDVFAEKELLENKTKIKRFNKKLEHMIEDQTEKKEQIKEAGENLNKDRECPEDKILSGSIPDMEKHVRELTTKIGKQRLKIKNLEFERERLLKWIEENPGNPVVKVDGIIMAKTIVRGIHSSTIIEEEVKNVHIREVKDTSISAGPDTYKIEFMDK